MRVEASVFIKCLPLSSPYFWRLGLSLNSEFANSARPTFSPRDPLPSVPQTGVSGTISHGFVMRVLSFQVLINAW